MVTIGSNGSVSVFNILPNQIKRVGIIEYHKDDSKMDSNPVADVAFISKGSEGTLSIIEE